MADIDNDEYSEEQRKADDEYVKTLEPGIEIGMSIGLADAYDEVQQAYDNEGLLGVDKWLEHNRPKTLEDWSMYCANTDFSALPWNTDKRKAHRGTED